MALKVQPKARRPGFGGVLAGPDGAWLRLAAAAPAEDGAANDAVRRALAVVLAVPAGAVTLRGGAAARQKRLHVAGDPAALGARLAALG